jgi:stress response protein SCP2
MAINLQKGQRISLTKEAPGLKKIICGLGWDVVEQTGGGLFGAFRDLRKNKMPARRAEPSHPIWAKFQNVARKVAIVLVL